MHSTLAESARTEPLAAGPPLKAFCKCGDGLSAHHVAIFGSECHPCRIRRVAVADIRRLAERVIRGENPEALEAAVGRLADICLERGL